MPKFSHYKQLDSMDCGPTCLRMIAKYYGKTYSLQYLRSRSYITREGVSMLGISEAAGNIGFRTRGYRLSWEELHNEVPLPCIFQLVHGMQEIKLSACEKQKRWEWESIQARLYRVSVKGLVLNQSQQIGATFINQAKNLFISFLSAKAVIEGDMTLGMMMAVQYIIGQLNAPIQQFIGFTQQAQDAKISLERLGEIHDREDEEKPEDGKIREIPRDADIELKNIMFQYEGPHSPKVLKKINLKIPANKVTAIVGTSGSGKTTLIKLMLGFYQPVKGKIHLNGTELKRYSESGWRKRCGVVMQEGYIFSDSIANNIGIIDDLPDKETLEQSVITSNIGDFIETLPLGYNTKIGTQGHGLSTGQKQRILIARAVYKNPDYIFLDEATNALDAKNERVIMENLDNFFRGRTVIRFGRRAGNLHLLTLPFPARTPYFNKRGGDKAKIK